MYKAHCKPSRTLECHLKDDIHLKLFSQQTGIPILRLLKIRKDIGNATHEEMVIMAFHLKIPIDDLRGESFIPISTPEYINFLHT